MTKTEVRALRGFAFATCLAVLCAVAFSDSHGEVQPAAAVWQNAITAAAD